MNKIVVSVTSWKKRINILPKTLFYFITKQTKKPDLIYLTLSSNEFPNKEKDLPSDLNLLIKKFKIEVNWMEENIFCHKKYEVFKKYSDCHVFLIDDDLFYPIDHIEKLLKSNEKFSNCVHCYYSFLVNYKNGKKEKAGYIETPALNNVLLSGLSYFPPNIFPIESFKEEKLRDKISPKCDDSWINAWLLKKGIKIVAYKNYLKNNLDTIPNTQEVGIWACINSKTIKNVNQKYINLSKCLYFLKVDIKNIWPQMNIDKYSNY